MYYWNVNVQISDKHNKGLNKHLIDAEHMPWKSEMMATGCKCPTGSSRTKGFVCSAERRTGVQRCDNAFQHSLELCAQPETSSDVMKFPVWAGPWVIFSLLQPGGCMPLHSIYKGGSWWQKVFHLWVTWFIYLILKYKKAVYTRVVEHLPNVFRFPR